jgi:hypothetical protein
MHVLGLAQWNQKDTKMDHIQVGNLLSVNRLNSEIFAVFLFQQKKEIFPVDETILWIL